MAFFHNFPHLIDFFHPLFLRAAVLTAIPTVVALLISGRVRVIISEVCVLTICISLACFKKAKISAVFRVPGFGRLSRTVLLDFCLLCLTSVSVLFLFFYLIERRPVGKVIFILRVITIIFNIFIVLYYLFCNLINVCVSRAFASAQSGGSKPATSLPVKSPQSPTTVRLLFFSQV